MLPAINSVEGGADGADRGKRAAVGICDSDRDMTGSGSSATATASGNGIATATATTTVTSFCDCGKWQQCKLRVLISIYNLNPKTEREIKKITNFCTVRMPAMMLQIRDKSLKITFNFATENAKPQIDAAARRGFFFSFASFFSTLPLLHGAQRN